MPETFALGSLQAREAIFAVLSENVQRGDLNENRAMEIVKKMLSRMLTGSMHWGCNPFLLREFSFW